MKNKKLRKRILSFLLAVITIATAIVPAFSASAANGVEGVYEIQLFYKDTNTIVPSYIDDQAVDKKPYIEYMVEGEELNLTYKLIGTEMPDNGYIKWYSETPALVDVTQEGVVKAFDSSKGAVIQAWIDNEVKTIPLVGSLIATVIEKALFNEYVDLDSMDTEAIIDVVEAAFGSDSPIAGWIESYKGELIDSLRYYLDNINSNIHVQLYAADGTLLADDFVQICVEKNKEWYANILPNGTHITNKSQINTTVAVGSTVQLYAVTTPLRLHYGCIYSVKSTSIFDKGKVVATVDDSGLVTFKNTGTVTIVVSPDTEQIIQGILELVNYIYKLENTGTINSDKAAEILIKYVGLDINRTVLAAILDVCFAIKDIAGDAADPVQLTATAVEIISNLVLQFVYNDTITFNVVEAQPLTDFSIEGATTVKEGSQIQMSIVDVKPDAGDTSDITWTSSDPSVASVDPKTGVITGRDAGGSLGELSKNKCVITATSAANNVSKSVELTVTGKTGKYLSDVEILGKTMLDAPDETDYSYSVYPARVANSDNLYIQWGILSGYDEEQNPIYLWADEENTVTDGIGIMDHKGHYIAQNGGICTIAVKAYTGYPISNGFYEISSYIGTLEVTNGIPIESIKIDAVGATSNGKLNKVNTVNINGTDYTYATIHKNVMEAYAGNGAKLSAAIYPENASNKTLKWVVDNSNYATETTDETHSCNVTQKTGHEIADTFNVYAVSEDGQVKSNVITVCVTRNYAVSNVINEDSIEVIRGKQADATHTISFDGSWSGNAYACYKCNWYSSDESIFTVETKNNDNKDATITAVDVGKATLYCVSADGGIVDSCEVTVFPDKTYLENIVNLCNSTVVRKTNENKDLYKKYMKKLDLAYYVLYDDPMASQTTCDTYAAELLYAFYQIGGFVGIAGVDILGTNKTPLESDYITIKVGSTSNYTKYSYDFDYKVTPNAAMYSDVTWTSSNDSIEVDRNGKCKPTSNNACSALITCTVKDYMGVESSDSVYIAFTRTPVTGVTINPASIDGGKIGESQQLTANVEPKGTLGVGAASCTDIHWSSSDENIATVDKNGVVTFVAGGDCVIYCTTNDGGITAECAVNVVTNYSNLELLIRQYTDLSLSESDYYPESWGVFTAAMDEAKAMIEQGGYAQSEVDAMYAKLENAYKSLKKYNYIQKVELYLDGEATKDFYQYDLSLLSEGISYKNAVLDLNVRIYPNNGSYASVKWESSTTDIAVSQDGKCSPTINSYCYGRITCTVTDHYGNEFSDDVWVSYSYIPVTGVELSETNISGTIGTTHQLTCSIKPDGSWDYRFKNANIKDYFWESDDENVATVDETGLVTFVNAGSTIVRAVSYDGGISGECVVSSGGDRSKLKAVIDEYQSVDYTEYEYEYGTAFKEAYENALVVLSDNTCTQEHIDRTTNVLTNAYNELILHPYVKVDGIILNYTGQKKTTAVSKPSSVESGTIGSNDAVSINLSSYSSNNTYNDIVINASSNPANAMYKSISWSVDSSSGIKYETENSSITFTPKNRSDGAWAVTTVTFTDYYDRTTSRTFFVVMSDNTMDNFSISETEKSIYATAAPSQIEYTITGTPEFSKIYWSSSNTDVLTVNDNGVVTPVEKGTATVTAKTLDGGFSHTIKFTVMTDFRQLAEKQSEYYNLIENVKDSYTYTEDSLANLSKAVVDAKTMIDENTATQAEVNAQLDALNNAFHSLIEYVAATGVTFDVSDQSNVTSENEGFVRYTGVALNGKTINLNPAASPKNAVYTEMTFTSSNPDITVDENGVVKNNTAKAGAAKITCTVTNIHGDSYESSIYVSFVRYGTTSISFNEEMVFGAPSHTVTLAPVITNSNNSHTESAIVKDCIYTSSDENIATVDENGVVTFITQGEAIITATTLDGGFTATVTACTTWDTAALKAAIEEAEGINYMDYAYSYGTAFKNALDAANSVYANVHASQEEIDAACMTLTEAKTALEGHEFVAPVITIAQNATAVDGSTPLFADENNQVILDIHFNENAMVKSSSWSFSNEVNAFAQVNDNNQLVITKTSDDDAQITVTATVVDDYDRETTKTVSLRIVDSLKPATSIALTSNGEVVSEPISITGCGTLYANFSGLTFGYIPTPSNANAIVSVSYTSSANDYVQIDENGVISLTSRGKIRSSNTTTITCTVTNTDGTTASSSILLTIAR